MKRIKLRNWPLRLKVTVLLIAVSVLPLALTAFLEIREIRLDRVRGAQELLTARADQIVRELDTLHKGYRHATERVAAFPAVLAYCVAPPSQRAALAEHLRGIFSTFHKSDETIRGLAIVNPDARIVVASDNTLVGENLSARPIIREALQGKTVISAVNFAPWEGEVLPTVAYVVPVRDTADRVVCVLTMGVRADVYGNVLKATHEQAGIKSFAVLEDQWGIRIGLSGDQSTLYRPSGKLEPALVEAQVAQRRFGPRTSGFLEDVKSFPEQFERARSASPDTKVFRGWAPANNSWNFGVARRLATVPWTVFYFVPETSILVQVEQATQNKVLVALVIVLVAAVVGVAFATSILRPISALCVATAELAAGGASARVVTHGNDELAKLGNSFNAMAERIQQQGDELRRSNDELRHHTKGLEVANKDLDAFVHSVSHDLRAPLHVVDGFCQILAKKFAGQLDERASHYLSRIHAGVSLMEQLVEGLLGLSELGRRPLHKRPVNMMEVVNEALTQLRGAEGLTDDRVQVTGDFGVVMADHVLLRQVFANLLSNAWKFTGKRLDPEIRLGCESQHGQKVYFVRDNGAGFDPAYASKLFEPFQRLHRTDEFAGLGLGLSIVKRIVERHGGRIWVEAALGRGACFYFTLGEPVGGVQG